MTKKKLRELYAMDIPEDIRAGLLGLLNSFEKVLRLQQQQNKVIGIEPPQQYYDYMNQITTYQEVLRFKPENSKYYKVHSAIHNACGEDISRLIKEDMIEDLIKRLDL